MFSSDSIQILAESWVVKDPEFLEPADDLDGAWSEWEAVRSTLIIGIPRGVECRHPNLSIPDGLHG